MKSVQAQKKRVFVAMSGGVDSSVAAALLQSDGYDVTGVFMKVWYPSWQECDWQAERRDAMRVAARLGIPLLTFDFGDIYKKDVVDAMVAEYEAGRTPNPDVSCNRYVKFGAFAARAREMGADCIATGHYARLEHKDRGDREGKYALLEAQDKNKDQTYFLWTLTQEDLSRSLFPIGDFEKKKVRALAEKFGLPNAEKRDSQGLCFVGKVDFQEFLRHFIPEKPGSVLNRAGSIIGTHTGAVFFTIGQRHGFVVTKKSAHDAPLYVVGKDIPNNTLTVAPDLPEEREERREIFIEPVNWIRGEAPDEAVEYRARIRYRGSLEQCTIKLRGESGAVVMFAKPQRAVTVGQSLVLYSASESGAGGGECVGGGVIREF